MVDNTTSAIIIDKYGFERPPEFDYKTYDEFMSRYVAILARRAGRWATILDGNDHELTVSQKLKRFIRKGIPSEHRPMVWMYVSGAEQRRREHPDLFRKLLDGPQESQLVELIKIDMHRTFPDNVYFRDDLPDTKSAKCGALFNVLTAIAHNNRHIGYCQGMNFIAGLMLIIMQDEEKVFWLMDTLINKILPDYYTPDMVGIKVDCEVLGELVRLKCPDVYRLTDSCGCAWSIVATKWFICLFVDVIPVETVLRIWDSLFLEGSKILFRVGVTLVKRHSNAIMQCRSFPEVMAVFRGISSSPLTTNSTSSWRVSSRSLAHFHSR
jgi:hypothetical protein